MPTSVSYNASEYEHFFFSGFWSVTDALEHSAKSLKTHGDSLHDLLSPLRKS